MITLKKSIENINDYQCGNLPAYAKKLEAPTSIDDMIKKAFPIMLVMCLIMVSSMFIKAFISRAMPVFFQLFW